MKVLVTGSTGLVGSALVPSLVRAGHEVQSLVRRPPRPGEIQWDPQGGVDPRALEGADALVHLAGESLVGRWTKAKKTRIRESRVQGTTTLARALAGLERAPKVFLCASAIGFYGDRGEESLDERSPIGSGFLAEVCRDWEAATTAARAKGIRVANLRSGMMLSPKGGALAKMLPPFKLGVGGIIGSGRQYMSWIALDDVVAAIHHALATEELAGPVNFVSPSPVTNREFTKTLGRVLARPTVLPMPAFGVRLLFGGEMADEMLLASARVEPAKLAATRFRFSFAELEDALRHVLGKEALTAGRAGAAPS